MTYIVITRDGHPAAYPDYKLSVADAQDKFTAIEPFLRKGRKICAVLDESAGKEMQAAFSTDAALAEWMSANSGIFYDKGAMKHVQQYARDVSEQMQHVYMNKGEGVCRTFWCLSQKITWQWGQNGYNGIAEELAPEEKRLLQGYRGYSGDISVNVHGRCAYFANREGYDRLLRWCKFIDSCIYEPPGRR